MTERSGRLHINVNILNAGVFGGSWRFPGHDPLGAYDLAHYLGIARKAEQAKLDAVFLADGPVVEGDLAYRPGNGFEPSVLLARIAAETSRIGLIGTFSSSYNDADELAARLGAIDALSGGRFGWNVVTTAGARAAANFGRDAEPEHGARYRRAAEVTARVVSGWAGHEGAPAAPTSPQGRPVVVQAGASRDGIGLAGEHAEVIFTAAQTLEEGLAFRAAIDESAAGFGRRPEEVVILPGVSTVIASTEAEATERRALLAASCRRPTRSAGSARSWASTSARSTSTSSCRSTCSARSSTPAARRRSTGSSSASCAVSSRPTASCCATSAAAPGTASWSARPSTSPTTSSIGGARVPRTAST
jgi:alkanesulfonate monooxygenase SsuD/methylene tetrahydromethanopterin reductase-like flavin-dependent oxidoreductase (luciferase family)